MSYFCQVNVHSPSNFLRESYLFEKKLDLVNHQPDSSAKRDKPGRGDFIRGDRGKDFVKVPY